jgi:uncharacterized protein (TIRG00374 family)
MSPQLRRVITVAMVAIAAIAILVIVGDSRSVGKELHHFGWWSLGAALVLSLGNYAIRGLRWIVYCRWQGITTDTRLSLLIFTSGLSLAITPGKVGEVSKSYMLRELDRVPMTRSVPIVIAERVTDLTALLVLATVGALYYGIAVSAVIISAAVIFSGLALLAFPSLGQAAVHLATQLRWTRPLRARLLSVYEGLTAVCRPRRLTTATLIGIAAWLCECTGFALIVHGFPGATIDLGLAIQIYAVTTILGALSFLPGGLGVTEGAMTLLLVQSGQGITTAVAVAATILIRLATLWFGVFVGLVALGRVRKRIAAQVHDREAGAKLGLAPPPVT